MDLEADFWGAPGGPSTNRFLSFVLLEKERNQWYNNNGCNYHIDMSLDNFRACCHDTSYQIEKEVSDYLNYSEHLNLKSANV